MCQDTTYIFIHNKLQQEESQLKQLCDLEGKIEDKNLEVIQLKEELRVSREAMEQQSIFIQQMNDERVKLEVKVTKAEEQIQGESI